MKIKTARFGELEVSGENVYNFPEGVLGFPQHKDFAFISLDSSSPLYLLQSCDDAELAFVVCDPKKFLNDYEIKINKDFEKKLDFKTGNEKQIFVTLTFAKKKEDTTVNLKGPIVFNTVKKIGAQVVLEDSRYTTKYRIFKGGNEE